jgi:hypothetical protein
VRQTAVTAKELMVRSVVVFVYPVVDVGAMQSVWEQPAIVYALPAEPHTVAAKVPVYPVVASQLPVTAKLAMVSSVLVMEEYPVVEVGAMQSVCVQPATAYTRPTPLHTV